MKGIKKPTFGGKVKTGSKPPNKTANKMLGGMNPRKKASDIADTMDRGIGNVERGFMQATPKQATGAMMGRAPPPLIGGMGPTPPTMKGKKQFKPKGKKVF